jgi:hypothetical protein
MRVKAKAKRKRNKERGGEDEDLLLDLYALCGPRVRHVS